MSMCLTKVIGHKLVQHRAQVDLRFCHYQKLKQQRAFVTETPKAFYYWMVWVGKIPQMPRSSPDRTRNTQGMSGIGEEEDRHTQKVAQKRQLFFILRIAQFLQNERYLRLKSPHITSDIILCICQYFSFPCFSPVHSSRMFPITGFIFKCPIHSLLASMA